MVFRLHECTVHVPQDRDRPATRRPAYIAVDIPADVSGQRLCIVTCGQPDRLHYQLAPTHWFQLVGERCGHHLIGGRVEPRSETANPAPPTRL